MNTLINPHIEIWRSHCRQSIPMVTFKADLPTSSPLSYIWFVFTLEEWKKATKGGLHIFNDGYHKMETFGEMWVFFDMEYPKSQCGEKAVKYYTVNIPRRVQHILNIGVHLALSMYDKQSEYCQDRVKIDLSPYISDWMATYGQGKGSVKIFAYDEVITRLNSFSGNVSFDRCMESLHAMASNLTYQTTDVGEIHIWNDNEDFGWNVGNLYGGLINHGTMETPNWSLHT